MSAMLWSLRNPCTPSLHNRKRSCNATGCEAEISIDDGNNVNISGNYIANGHRSGIDIEPPGSNHVTDVMGISNTFGPTGSFWSTIFRWPPRSSSAWFMAACIGSGC